MPAAAPIDFDTLTDKLRLSLDAAQTPDALAEAVANAPFEFAVEMAFIFLGFISFFLVDEERQEISLPGVSDNEFYHDSIKGYSFDPALFRVKLDDPRNAIARSIRENKEIRTEDWEEIRRPEAKDGVARINQASAGIGYSVIRPLTGAVRGAIMFNYYQYQDDNSAEADDFMEHYTQLVSEVYDQALEFKAGAVAG